MNDCNLHDLKKQLESDFFLDNVCCFIVQLSDLITNSKDDHISYLITNSKDDHISYLITNSKDDHISYLITNSKDDHILNVTPEKQDKTSQLNICRSKAQMKITKVTLRNFIDYMFPTAKALCGVIILIRGRFETVTRELRSRTSVNTTRVTVARVQNTNC